MTSDPMEVFQKEAPEVTAVFNGLIPSWGASKGIDPEVPPEKMFPSLPGGSWLPPPGSMKSLPFATIFETNSKSKNEKYPRI
jgi:hypothetical protein